MFRADTVLAMSTPATHTAPATHPCFGCQTPIADEPGNAYCPECIAQQMREQGDELEAFDAYHAYADRIARS
jgi:Zn finger protein HypA/HybF involved in hydrogenase expression